MPDVILTAQEARELLKLIGDIGDDHGIASITTLKRQVVREFSDEVWVDEEVFGTEFNGRLYLRPTGAPGRIRAKVTIKEIL